MLFSSLRYFRSIVSALEIALRELYSSNLAPDILRSAMKSLLKLAVTNVHFKCNGIWYVQSDGLAMAASLIGCNTSKRVDEIV